MKTILLLVFVCACGLLHAQSPAAVKTSEAMHVEKIPIFEVKDASVAGCIEALRGIWERAHPKEPFPVTLKLDDPDRQKDLSLVLKDVSCREVINHVANLCNLSVTERRGWVVLAPIGPGEVWRTQMYATTPAVISALGLNSKSTAAEVKAAFGKLGVEFPQGMMAALASDGTAFVVTNEEDQQTHVAAILLILGKGFKITK